LRQKLFFKALYGRGSVQHLKVKRNTFSLTPSERLDTLEGTTVLKIIISTEFNLRVTITTNSELTSFQFE